METKTPEQLAEEAKKIAAAKAKKQAEFEARKLAINSAGEDANVRILLSMLYDLCGGRENPVVISKDSEVTNATIYNVGRLSVFCDLRKYMSAETENLIERRNT